MKCIIAVMLLLGTSAAGAQSPNATDSTARFAFQFRFAFNPDMVLRQGGEVGLERAQSSRIKAEIDRATAGFTAIRQQLEAQQRELDRLLAMPRVDEAAAMRTLGAILRIESELKRLQLTVLIRTKNALSPEQQRSLLGMGRAAQ